MTALPADVGARVAVVLGADPARLRVQPVGGGCISPAARVDAPGATAFVKWRARGAPAGMFVEEAAALAAIARTRTVRVPAVLAVADDLLVLEWLEPGAPGAAAWSGLGRALARLHRTTARQWGWASDNFIGSLPQPNAWTDTWATFFRERRILPRLRQARADGAFDGADDALLDRFVAALDALCAPGAADGPSLLHGDLWNGNALPLADGGIALVDPASCFGHREMDLAMAELFGGFPAAFFEAYEDEWSTADEARTRRRAAYRVYYLLVHVNLFGGGYARAAVDAARTALG